jgi:hypothetical protein
VINYKNKSLIWYIESYSAVRKSRAERATVLIQMSTAEESSLLGCDVLVLGCANISRDLKYFEVLTH